MMPIANCTLSSRIVYADHFQASIFWILLNYFMFIFFLRPLCALYSPLHGRLAKADCTTPCKICSQAFKTHCWRQVMFGRIFWEGHFFKFQSNLFLWFELLWSFLISGHFLSLLWSTVRYFLVMRLIKQQFCNFFSFFSLHGLVSLQSKVANKVIGILGFLHLCNHSKYNGVNSSVMHHLYIISIGK